MGLYGFKDRFAPFILDGSKPHTIRGPRRFEDTPGRTMHLFTGVRTKAMALIFRAPCILVRPVVVTEDERLYLDGDELRTLDADRFAWSDGFRPARTKGRRKDDGAYELMLGFWRQENSLPFAGKVYHWDYSLRRMTK